MDKVVYMVDWEDFCLEVFSIDKRNLFFNWEKQVLALCMMPLGSVLSKLLFISLNNYQIVMYK